MQPHQEKWAKAKRQARNIKRRKNKRLAIHRLMGMIKEALK